MKKLITITLSAIVALSACTKKSGSSSSLNSTESKLVGTWYLQKEEMKGSYLNLSTGLYQDTTYSGYNSSYYLILKSDRLTGSGAADNWKQETQSFGAAPVTLPAVPSGSTGSASGYWYFDDASSSFHIVVYQYTIETLNSSELVLKQSASSGNNYYYFHK